MSSNDEVTYSEGKVHPSDDGSQPSWDVHTLIGRYVSTDFVMSDAKGNTIHSSAKANVAHNFLKLKEGLVYCLKNFVVQSNKEEYRIFRNHTYMIELNGATSVRKASVKSGRISHQKSGSRTLDFSLANGSEDEVSLSQAAVHADYSQAKVKIDDITSRKGWNFPGCCSEKCNKGVVRKNESFWCQSCEKAVDYPALRFWLELDISDKIASTVVVIFDEPAKELIKIAQEEVVDVDSESSNMNTSAEVNITKVKRLSTKPSVAIPSKPTRKGKKREELENSDEEVTCDMDDGGADGKESSLTDKRKKTRYIVDDCDFA
nr:hypothetical protein [Tanacetum cinerariifolium]